ncbi:MAG: 2-oxo acid dehydrogenase subunit E2 [Planctomycetes bacterium]|nr:2-oxo acid dehydrogenase subunit E2 [Planctomycetota bacterium]MBU4398668.1 2-oxo acid dehydrogenase subunit E2 [Planctomycetota bacterium]MCG2683024.1 2-oxo acid dehydrogenase subunit E2 [Planctomycetales bacterium]
MNADFKLPEIGGNVAGGDVVGVLVREGDVIAANDGVIELETDKAVLEIPCTLAGQVTKVHVAKGQTVKVGQPLLTVKTEVETVAKPHDAKKPRPSAAPAGPEARRLARELGVDLARVQGTGKRGRITVEDVRAAAVGSSAGIPAQRGSREPAVPPGELGEDSYGPVRRERMSKIRRTIAAQMVTSASTIPHVTNFDDADVTELERMRKTIPPAYLGPTIKLTAMPFVIRAAALALRQHPLLNASIDEEKEQIVYKQYVNVGVAVDTPRGLVVPVMRGADRMSILHIARELTLLAARARSAEFTVDELRGGTFTVSNLGAVGSVYSTPIINHPEVAILLLGRSRWMLSVFEGKIEGRLKMPLSLSFDHRVVDGGAAGRFLNDVIDYLQSPGKLLLTK